MRRIALTAAVTLLAVPGAASANPILSLQDTGSSGWLKGPFVSVPFDARFPDSGSFDQSVQVYMGPSGFTGLSSPAVLGPFADESGPFMLGAQAFDTHLDGPLLKSGASPVISRGPFRIDNSPPVGTGFVGFDPATSGNTNRYSVRIVMNGPFEAESGLGMVQIGFTPDLQGCGNEVANGDGTGCYRFVPNDPKRQITLSGPDGVKDIYIRWWDRAAVPCGAVGSLGGRPVICPPDGNASAVYHGTLRLDTQAPALALAGGTTQAGVAGVPTTLDATPSTDPGESGIRSGTGTRWTFGDGTPDVTGGPLKITHTYPGPGSFKGSVRAEDLAGNPAVLNFTVNVAPAGSTVGGGETPAPGGGQTPTGGGGGPTPAPAGGTTPAGGGAGGGAGATPAPGAGTGAAVKARPRVLGLGLKDRRPSLRVTQAGVATVVVRTLAGRKLATFTRKVTPGANRLVAPGRLGEVLPDEGKLKLQITVASGGVAGPVFTSRVSAVALNPQPLPPKETPARTR